MKTPDRNLLSFTIVSVLILVIGYVIGSKFMNLRDDGAFARWEDFSAPLKAEKIVEATSYMLWIETSDGSIYAGNPYCQQNSDCMQQWQAVDSIPVDLNKAGQLPLKRNSDCDFNEYPSIRTVPGKPIECVHAQFAGPESGSTIYYALLEDGTITTWKYSGSMIEDFWTVIFISSIMIVIWVVALLVFDLRSRKKAGLVKKSNTG
ncbi:MAG TPA: hypothetical protein VJ785_06125 [Anaerolineales bacterium]|nr:hypothetical protein [Anaerolineales bacterium]